MDPEPHSEGIEMATWQVFILFILAGSAIGCLFEIYKAVQKLSDAIFSVRRELTRMNAKLQAIEVDEPDQFFEAAIRDIERLAEPRA